MCLLRYLSVKKSIDNWEAAFLINTIIKPEEELEVKMEWRPHVSLTNLNSTSITTLYETYTKLENGLRMLKLEDKANPFRIPKGSDDTIDKLKDVCDEIRSIEIDIAFRNFQEPYLDLNETKTQAYAFETSCVVPIVPKIKKSKKSKSKKQKSRTSVKHEQDEQKQSTTDFLIENKLKIVFTTIKVLLSCGADPNIGEAPMPALIICLFCGDAELLRLLLDSSADANVVAMDENLSPLHILAMLPFSKENVDMMELLLEEGADPNCKTNANHWMEEKTKIIGRASISGEDLGKTPLHILSMRYDFKTDKDNFLSKMVKHLIDFNADSSENYLGHTPFSLAVLRANLELIRFYLDTSSADPNEPLGEGMGVALTVPILKRYAGVMTAETGREVYELLMSYNVNPLRDVNDLGNAVEFMYKEHEIGETREKKKSAKSNKSKSNKSKSLDSGKSSKSSKKKGKNDPSALIKDIFLNCSRKLLERHTQYNAFKYITYFILENSDLYDEATDILAQFLTLSDAQRIIQILLRKRLIHPSDATYNLCTQILHLVKNAYVPPKKGKTKEDKRTPEDVMNALDLVTTDAINKFGLIEPEVDANKDRYKICFYCCRKTGRILIACPNCGLVYFCSEECNKLSMKYQKNSHKCGVLFYNKEKKRQDEARELGFEYHPVSKLDEKLNDIKNAALRRYLDRKGQGDGFDVDFDGDFDFTKAGKYAGVFGPGREGSTVEQGTPWGVGSDYLSGGTRKGTTGGKGSRGDFSDEQKLDREGGKKSTGEGERDEEKLGKEVGKKSRGDGGRGARGDFSDEKKLGKGVGWSPDVDKRSRRGGDTKSGKRSEKGSAAKSKFSQGKAKSISSGKGKRSGGYGKSSMLDRFSHYGKLSKSGGRSGLGREGIGRYGKEGKGKIGRKYGKSSMLDRFSHDTKLNKSGGRSGLGRDGFGRYGKGSPLDSSFPYPRLSNKYQYFLERLSEFFPDFDISMLFLPYACFVDGQLYYRFLDERPLFCLTYSNV